MIDERQLDHCWEIIIKPALLEYFNKKPYLKQDQNTFAETENSRFNLNSIKWKVGSGQFRRDADPDEPFSYAFVTDMQGEIYPEIKPLYDEVCRYGEVHTEGWVITPFGDRIKMLAKRRPKEA